MQNYHTSSSNPDMAILNVLRTADPIYGVTAMQIAAATGLNLVHEVIPVLRGLVRATTIVGSPQQQREGMSFILATKPAEATNVYVHDAGELTAHLVDAGDVPPQAPQTTTCPDCSGTGRGVVYVLNMTFPTTCQRCSGTGTITIPSTPPQAGGSL